MDRKTYGTSGLIAEAEKVKVEKVEAQVAEVQQARQTLASERTRYAIARCDGYPEGRIDRKTYGTGGLVPAG
jgi:hypothetical protein